MVILLKKEGNLVDVSMFFVNRLMKIMNYLLMIRGDSKIGY